MGSNRAANLYVWTAATSLAAGPWLLDKGLSLELHLYGIGALAALLGLQRLPANSVTAILPAFFIAGYLVLLTGFWFGRVPLLLWGSAALVLALSLVVGEDDRWKGNVFTNAGIAYFVGSVVLGSLLALDTSLGWLKDYRGLVNASHIVLAIVGWWGMLAVGLSEQLVGPAATGLTRWVLWIGMHAAVLAFFAEALHGTGHIIGPVFIAVLIIVQLHRLVTSLQADALLVAVVGWGYGICGLAIALTKFWMPWTEREWSLGVVLLAIGWVGNLIIGSLQQGIVGVLGFLTYNAGVAVLVAGIVLEYEIMAGAAMISLGSFMVAAGHTLKGDFHASGYRQI